MMMSLNKKNLTQAYHMPQCLRKGLSLQVEQSSAGLAEQLQAAGPSGSAGLRIPSAPQSQQQVCSSPLAPLSDMPKEHIANVR